MRRIARAASLVRSIMRQLYHSERRLSGFALVDHESVPFRIGAERHEADP